MSTLWISEMGDDGDCRSSLSLRQWLGGHWAILFSHPDDFVHCELELDRWLAIVGDAFARARVRPIALSRRTRPIDQGWVSELGGPTRLVCLKERTLRSAALDFHARRLRAFIESVEQRFALIIDSELRARQSLLYGATERPPSPLDLVRLACRLRDAERQKPLCTTNGGESAFAMSVRRARAVCACA